MPTLSLGLGMVAVRGGDITSTPRWLVSAELNAKVDAILHLQPINTGLKLIIRNGTASVFINAKTT